MIVKTCTWAYGSLEVQSLGAMAGPIRFHLSDGRVVQPMQIAPWADEPGAEHLPGILQRLRGEWPCVPFGIARALSLTGDWAGVTADLAAGPTEPHGASSNNEWVFEEDATGLTLSFSPTSGPVRRMQRHIRPDPKAPAVNFGLTVEVDQPCRLPVGLHPVFSIPEGGAVLSVPGAKEGQIFPAEVEPGVSRLVPGGRITNLSAAPCVDGTNLDITQLPLPFATEELVQLHAPGGRALLRHRAEAVTIALDWNAAHFPDVVLWLSNRGRANFPWNGRHVAIGIEPVAAAFDLGTAISTGENPFNAQGRATAISFEPSIPFETWYRISVLE